ncbi:hypothetical protein [Streptomyces longwoodensis]|uniref:hypothetical protein n=1 Tax=Streptomyces longwoodensis TaxID=68231 RepID=UPI00224E213A|nr:hypothetical protein [Streptomyces longwoodensis]MCX4994253.1 hypothetical protein [Streptomyces longwoodensis]
MTAINPPAWQQAGSYPARNDRLALSALLAYPGNSSDEASPLRIRPGVKPSYQNYQLKVRAAATPNMTVIVSGGICFVDQRETGGSGAYICANDADVTLNILAAGGAGQYRKDTVVASVYDAEYSGSLSQWQLEVIQGPYAASAGATVRGTLPANCIPLADIAIAPSQSSVSNANITDVRTYGCAIGGALPVASSAVPARPHPAQLFYLTDTDRWLYGKADGTTGELQRTPGAWSTWTPTWTTSTGLRTPSYGNAAVSCKYVKIGRLVTYYMDITFGTTTNFGSSPTSSDNWTFSLPVAAAVGFTPAGTAHIEPGNGQRASMAMAQVNSDLTTISLHMTGPRVDGSATVAGVVDSITPFVWGSTMRLAVVGSYESAS